MEPLPDSQLELEAMAEKLGLDPKDPGLRFATALSSGLKDESLRKFVSENIQDQFDGDLNFLYYTTKGQSIGGAGAKSHTFEEALFGSQSHFRSTESALEFDPLMQVALRGPEEQLVNFTDIEGDIPVLYVSPSQDLEANPIVPMITQNGEVSEWDIRTVPATPVLVISQNERLVKVPKNPVVRIQNGEACIQSTTPYFSDGTSNYYFYTDYFCGGGGIGGNPGGGSGGSTGCDRENNHSHDKLDRAKFESMDWMRWAEEWLDGAPEMSYILFTGASQPHLAQLPPKSLPIVDRSRWKDCGVFSCKPEWVFNIGLEMFNWDPQVYGRVVTIRFYEFDPGDSESRTNSVSVKDAAGNTQTFSRTWTVSNNDFDLFGSVVDYCDDATGSNLKIYTTGRFQFGITIDG